MGLFFFLGFGRTVWENDLLSLNKMVVILQCYTWGNCTISPPWIEMTFDETIDSTLVQHVQGTNPYPL